MSTPPKSRIDSIDLLKGLVMVVMALDHTRDFFHAPAFIYSPTDPLHTTWPIYLTRWITHYCAPTFSFLAGTSAFLVGRRKSVTELSAFLFKRGLWLAFIELTVVNFSWFFDIHFSSPALLTIWSLGVSMMVLAALVYLPRTAILIFSIIIIAGHDLLDGVHFPGSILWSVLHEYGIFPLGHGFTLMVGYPLIPWVAVMALGYWFGGLYNPSVDASKRTGILYTTGAAAVALFIMLRYINIYGDPHPFEHLNTASRTLMSFLNPGKYPPSWLYLLMTLGPALIFLANSEKLKGPVVNFFSTFGRVPFFFYIIHIYLIHLLALIAAQLTGFGWRAMILQNWVTEMPALKGFGFRLWVVYVVWITVVLAMYPLCKRFDNYKMNHKEKWWLSYL
jgi:uncharacterized membrane protein